MSVPSSSMQSVNGKRVTSQRMQQEPATPTQQEELIKYIYESWNKVSREFEHFCQNGAENSKSGPCVLYYTEPDPNPQLKDFEPFDLEAWWGKRFVENITRSKS